MLYNTSMYDIIFVGTNQEQYNKLKDRFFIVKKAKDVNEAQKLAFTKFFWIVHDDLEIDKNFTFNYVPDDWSQDIVHVFLNGEHYDGVALIPKSLKLNPKELSHRFFVAHKKIDIVVSVPIKYEKFYVKTYNDYITALENSHTEMFWIIPDYVNPTDRFKFDTYFSHHNSYDRNINHVYLNGKFHDGIVLCSKNSRFSEKEFEYKFIAHKKEVDIPISTPKTYDIVFISYKEPNADKNYQRLLKRFPNAKRVHGVKGIHQAHIEGAKLVDTQMFWIVDGDAVVLDDFKFDYQCAQWDKDVVHVWRSMNPINDLVYGYGGVKLFPTQKTIDMDLSKPDMTTSISDKFRAVGELSVITGFNTGEFETWKSAFRECCKLSSKIIDRQKDTETQERLNIWTSVGSERKYGDFAIIGAKAGREYGEKHAGDIEALRKINDFDWLEEKFNATT